MNYKQLLVFIFSINLIVYAIIKIFFTVPYRGTGGVLLMEPYITDILIGLLFLLLLILNRKRLNESDSFKKSLFIIVPWMLLNLWLAYYIFNYNKMFSFFVVDLS